MDKIANGFLRKVPCLACCHRDPDVDERPKMDGWMDGWMDGRGIQCSFLKNREEPCSDQMGSRELKIVFMLLLTFLCQLFEKFSQN